MTDSSNFPRAVSRKPRLLPWPRTAIATVALVVAGIAIDAQAQQGAPSGAPASDASGRVTTPPAQKKPAKPGAQGGPDRAASSASGAMGGMSPPAEKKPAKRGAQSGPAPAAPN